MEYEKARDLLITLCKTMPAKKASLSKALGRVLAEDIYAKSNVPPFDRSPYDGYAFIASDTREATKERPVTLRIIEEVAAGTCPTKSVTSGTAIKILTGAPVPKGADAIIMFEDTAFTDKEVTIFAPAKKGQNIARVGEDVRSGELLANKGTTIDAALAGTLAAQGILKPLIYLKPRIGIISTGDELADAEESISGAKIHDSNRYTLEAALLKAGATPIFIGSACDQTEKIAQLLTVGIESCDMIISTGGVSVGDYDMMPAALEMIKADILIRKLL